MYIDAEDGISEHRGFTYDKLFPIIHNLRWS